MRARDKKRVTALRFLNAAIKQIEIDGRVELDDHGITEVLIKQRKQRKNSLDQFSAGKREDLAQQEQFEIELIEEFLPEIPSEDELQQSISESIASLNAQTLQDMGRVMQYLKNQLPNHSDMKQVSELVRKTLSS